MVFSNAVDTSLVGQTGTGAFAGSVAPVFALPVANNINLGLTSTLSSASPIVLTSSSNYQQYVTGSTAQTLTLPVASTLAVGQGFMIVNTSSATVTIESSGGNTVTTVPGGVSQPVTCILNSGTTAASWYAQASIASGVTSITGTANQVIASAATGAVTLSTPQSIGTSSNVTFGSVTAPTIGVTDGSNASAGQVGEVISSTVATTTTGLSSVTDTNVTSISLTAGDWDVYGQVSISGAASTVIVQYECWCSTTSATIPALHLRTQTYTNVAITASGGHSQNTPYLRVSVSGTTTVYLSVQAFFTTSTAGVGGTIYARRAR